jgi:hypothetical protein
MIRFRGDWVPAHEVWHKMEALTVVIEAIDRFNERFPELASDETRHVVPLVRRRLKEIELRMPNRSTLDGSEGRDNADLPVTTAAPVR